MTKQYKGAGIVWDEENNRVLTRFKDGMCTTKNKRTMQILDNIGFAGEVTEEDAPITLPENIAELGGWTLKALKAYAAENGISVPTSAKKDEAIAAIVAAQQKNEGSGD